MCLGAISGQAEKPSACKLVFNPNEQVLYTDILQTTNTHTPSAKWLWSTISNIYWLGRCTPIVSTVLLQMEAVTFAHKELC